MSKSTNKKISLDKARNRKQYPKGLQFPPNGARRSLEIPFITGVLADLSGQSLVALPPVASRKFLEVDGGSFDQRMAAIKPRVAFSVPNLLNEEGGNLPFEVEFERMEDFRPEAIARKSSFLWPLFEQRNSLATLRDHAGVHERVAALLDQLLDRMDSMNPSPQLTHSEL